MGGGIAQVAAQSGIEVVLVDAQRDWAESGRKKIDAALDKLVQKGKLDAATRAAAMERIRVADGYAGVRRVRLWSSRRRRRTRSSRRRSSRTSIRR